MTLTTRRHFLPFISNVADPSSVYSLSLHDALPISILKGNAAGSAVLCQNFAHGRFDANFDKERSEEHTSELQSPDHLVCRLLLEKKKQEIRLYKLKVY